MKRKNGPGNNSASKPDRSNPVQLEEDRGRAGGDEALTDLSATDSHADEAVIVNEQRGNKTVNAPSQTAANASELNSYDDEIIDEV